MIVRGRDFAEIYDLVGIRVLVDSVRDCYAALGTIHARWKPVPGRFKDYIAMPKFNLYQSLHTTVIGPEGKPVELQIRTHAMHRRAEYGVAAHWKYKEDGSAAAARTRRPGRPVGVGDMAWLRQLLDWQRETADPGEFLDSLRFDLPRPRSTSSRRRATSSPLPAGLHPGRLRLRGAHRGRRTACIGARVNGRLVPLESEARQRRLGRGLHLQGRDAGPSRDWLNFVKLAAGPQQDPRSGSPSERREEAIEQGRERSPRRCASRACRCSG